MLYLFPPVIGVLQDAEPNVPDLQFALFLASGFAAAAVALAFTTPGLLAAGVGFAGTAAFGSFPVAIHRDATYVCTHDSWRPNFAFYLGPRSSVCSSHRSPIRAGYYLARRRKAIGRP